MSAAPVVCAARQGTSLWHGDALWQFKVTSEDSEGRFWLAELTAPPGWASPLHLHTREDETFVVLDGRLRVQIADQVHDVPVGASAFMPRDVPHAYRAEETSRFLVLGTPGGFDRWFFDTGVPAQRLELPTPNGQEPDYATYVASLQAHGVVFVAPPPLMT